MNVKDIIKEYISWVEPEEWRWLGQGAMVPITISAIIIAGGTIWSLSNIRSLSLADHISNGTVFLLFASVGALAIGVPSISFMYPSIKRGAKSFWRFAGALPVFILITILVWSIEDMDIKKSSKSVPDIIFEFKWPFGGQG